MVAVGDQRMADDPDGWVCKAGPKVTADPNETDELAWNSGENAPNPCQFRFGAKSGAPNRREPLTQMAEGGPAKAGPNITARHALPTASARCEHVTQMAEGGPAKAGPKQ